MGFVQFDKFIANLFPLIDQVVLPFFQSRNFTVDLPGPGPGLLLEPPNITYQKCIYRIIGS